MLSDQFCHRVIDQDEPHLSRSPATVNQEAGPGDHRSGVAGKENDRAHDFLQFARAAQLDLALDPSAPRGIGEGAVGERS